jgi:hypothetical protein
MSPEAVVAAILLLFPYMSGNNRSCVVRRQEAIVTQLREAEEMGVPAEVIGAVGFYETHWGCDAHEGGNWGAPIDASHRHTAGTHIHAARSLLAGFGRCGSWDGAISRFRTGRCHPDAVGARYLANVRTLIRRMESVAAGPVCAPGPICEPTGPQ